VDLRKFVCIFAFGENRCVAAVETGGKRHATGVSLLIVRISSVPKKKDHPAGGLSSWWT